jgi:hypothetical protein
MDEVRKAVALAHAWRKEQSMKLRQPLAKLTVTSPVDSPKDNLLGVIAQETNVKKVEWKNGDELTVEFDATLTEELKAEGEARELMREIQKLRKIAGLTVSDHVTVEAPTWPESWKTEIEQKTHSKLQPGAELKLQS